VANAPSLKAGSPATPTAATQLLCVTYLTADAIFAQLQEFSRLRPVGFRATPEPAYLSLIERLRKRAAPSVRCGAFSRWLNGSRRQKSRQESTVMKRLLLVTPLASKSLMGGGFWFRVPCLALLKIAALTPGDCRSRSLMKKSNCST